MEINTATTSTQISSSSSGSSGISSDFETFLKMLTVQMQNQDPLNPVDSSEYAVQLATFSSVEQQVLTNDLLQAMTSQISTSGLAQYANWIGMEALVDASVYYDGDPVQLSLSPDNLADDIWISVKNADGLEVDRRQAALGQSDFTWSGANIQNGTASQGLYSFSVESYAAGDLIETSPAMAYQRVTEARSGQSETMLVLTNGQEVSSTSVFALRAAD
ncbi:flagellar hook capping FlgD N-terminal domain-containing protein [Shimia thalassica]|uniref:flagellar hook capping FlgD N-terminal domain-containing protein n=1 Tax=Shimia thalassica TaxID=1715693 RepID=UPI001C08C4F6|nr:flagellar hook capping FlgD N-terminal domain-containing protein [Shimia thalassica]MBU2942363.1 flagellar hook assembly protein FlgD [Shimia thalassica]MDO6504291.1 flagellar hook capping FlgD N-terminal domain-containing protein [Shimia thalassica]